MGIIARVALKAIWRAISKHDAKRLAGQSPTPGVAGDRDIVYIDDGDRKPGNIPANTDRHERGGPVVPAYGRTD